MSPNAFQLKNLARLDAIEARTDARLDRIELLVGLLLQGCKIPFPPAVARVAPAAPVVVEAETLRPDDVDDR